MERIESCDHKPSMPLSVSLVGMIVTAELWRAAFGVRFCVSNAYN